VFYVRVAPGQDVKATQDRIDALYGARRHLTIQSNEVLKKGILRENAVVFAMFDILAMIAVIVAAFGVVNTLMVNILERTRELGSLRSIGMTKRQVAKMILAEAAMLGGIGGIFGIILGLFLERIFLMGASEVSGLAVQFVIPFKGILLGLLLAMFVSQLAALWPVRHAVRLRIVDAIQYE
jgi:putative ABC transport system permease protein